MEVVPDIIVELLSRALGDLFKSKKNLPPNRSGKESSSIATALTDNKTRTEVIVECMEHYLSDPEKLRGITIRHQAGFSSLTNPDYQGHGNGRV